MKLRIEISSNLLSNHPSGLIVSEIVKMLTETYSDAVQTEVSFNDKITVIFEQSKISANNVIASVIKFLREKYSVNDYKSVLKVTDVTGIFPQTLDLSAIEVEDKAPSADEGKSLFSINDKKSEKSMGEGMGLAKDGKGKDSVLATFGEKSLFDGASEECGDISSKDPSSSDEYLKKIEALVGADEFKALARELVAIAPIAKQSGSLECILNQNYLFAINTGYGLSTVLSLFAGLLGSLGLRKLSPQAVAELAIPNKGAEKEDEIFGGLRDLFNKLSEKFNPNNQLLICLDISEWMTNINNRSLRSFIREINKKSSTFVLVYRIPCVNEEIFNRVKDSITDMAFLKGVSFPALTQGQLRQYAESKLKEYSFALSNEAWNSFDEKIFQEKRDGKFYGFSTVEKVVSEMLYQKLLVCSKTGALDKTISPDVIEAICNKVENTDVGMETLDGMIGGDKIKQRVEEVIAQIEIARATGASAPCIHMRFIGNPGTGKTTVARIIGKVLKDKGVLRIGNFFEYSGRDFCGRYIGETAPKTSAMCRDAYGSILFIDEAYSLYRGDADGKDYGREALDTLIAEMENNRSDLVVIMAGYPNEMEKLMEGNQGLASRMPYVIEFPNFNREELGLIFKTMIKAPYVAEEGLLEKANEYFNSLPDHFVDSKQFSNARFVRNLFERTLAKCAIRQRNLKSDKIVITKEDFELASTDKEFKQFEKKTRKIGFR